MQPNDDDLNQPDFEQVTYEMAIETMCKIYKDLRRGGLGRSDAAAVVAQILRADDGLGDKNDKDIS